MNTEKYSRTSGPLHGYDNNEPGAWRANHVWYQAACCGQTPAGTDYSRWLASLCTAFSYLSIVPCARVLRLGCVHLAIMPPIRSRTCVAMTGVIAYV